MDNKNRSANHHTVLSRRDALRAGTAAVAVTGLAGCSSSPSDSASGNNPSAGSTDVFDYSEYLVNPTKNNSYEEELTTSNSSFYYVQPKSIAENEDNFDKDAYKGNNSEYFDGVEEVFPSVQNGLGISFDEIKKAMRYEKGHILTIESEVDIIARLEDNGFYDWGEPLPGDYNSYYTERYVKQEDEYTNPNAETDGAEEAGGNSIPAAVGVKDDQIILRSSVYDPERIEIIINAKNNETDRYADSSESANLLLKNLGNADWVGGWAIKEPTDMDWLSSLNNVVGYGWENSYNGETTRLKVVYVHENQEDVDIEAAREFQRDAGDWKGANNFDVSKRGKVVVINAQKDTEKIDGIV